MRLQKLVLHNIRTYVDETVIFPATSIMLSGDIGSGKSSLLLAIEFALFGIVRGELQGESLLRKGCREGVVELTFHVQEKDVTVKRTLRSNIRGIQQGAGSIAINNVVQEGTPLELRSHLYQLLGYPNVTNKNMLYRYTVYTPQEELKRIIVESSEARLDVLRKVFNIDTYKRAKENALVYLSSLREELVKLETRLEQLPLKQQERTKLKEEIDAVAKEVEELKPKQEAILQAKQLAFQRLQDVEQERQRYSEARKQVAVLEEKKKQLEIAQQARKQQELLQLEKKKELEVAVGIQGDVETMKLTLEQFQEKAKTLEKEQQEVIQQQVVLKTTIEHAEHAKDKVVNLATCPLCLQDVSETHKETITAGEEKKIHECLNKLRALQEKDITTQVEERKKKIETLQKQLQQEEVKGTQKKVLEEVNQTIISLEQEQKEVASELQETKEQLEEIQASLQGMDAIETKYQEAKEQYESVREKEQSIQSSITMFTTRKEGFTQQLSGVKEELILLIETKQQLTKKKQVQSWLKEHFLQVLGVIEKHVLLRIHQEFNSSFQEWFSFLLEDEHMNARVDESFTPFIEQQGHDIAFGDLSGGEKSSVALAYRLALNKVINQLSSVHTKDLLVLDEPTDGFSSQQVDKLKDVLDQLHMKQVVLVSHEPKVESFVEHVIRIEKEDGVSRIVS